MKGKVKAFDKKRGYGLIMGEDGREYLVHLAEVRDRPEELRADVQVEFDPVDTPKGPQAAEVRRA